MSRPKIIPDDVKKCCMALVQGYDRRRKLACSSLELHRVEAVEYAIGNVGQDLTERDRQILLRAILRSCTEGRKYPFEKLGVDMMERTCFYDRRTKFLTDIAKYMEMV